MEIILNTKETAAFFDVTRKTLQNWYRYHGCPRISAGYWDLKAVFNWWRGYTATRTSKKAG